MAQRAHPLASSAPSAAATPSAWRSSDSAPASSAAAAASATCQGRRVKAGQGLKVLHQPPARVTLNNNVFVQGVMRQLRVQTTSVY